MGGWLLEFYHGPLLWGLVDVTSPPPLATTTTGERTFLSLNTGNHACFWCWGCAVAKHLFCLPLQRPPTLSALTPRPGIGDPHRFAPPCISLWWGSEAPIARIKERTKLSRFCWQGRAKSYVHTCLNQTGANYSLILEKRQFTQV